MNAFLRCTAPAILFYSISTVQAEVWVGPSPSDGSLGGSWQTNTHWNPNTVPIGIGASSTFDNNPAASPAQRNINLDGAVKVGSITINNNNNSPGVSNVIQDGTGGSLEFDATSGPATISSNGTGNSQNRINATMVLTDSVTINVTNTNEPSSVGAFSFLGSTSGPGGVTKTGPGTMTMAFVPSTTNTFKDYTGPTVIDQGRMRFSASSGSPPRMTSSVTVNPGGQIIFTGAGTITFGSQLTTLPNLNLNGTGRADFPGAIRPDVAGTSFIANPIVLQSDASINVTRTTALYTLQGEVSGAGRFELGTQPGNPLDQGTLTFSVANSYSGGTLVTQGTLVVGSSSNLGTGNVMVDGTTPVGVSRANGKLTLQTNTAIPDTAYLNITGDEGLDGAIGGFVTLDSGADEVVGGLMLGGKIIGAGTYSSTATNAAGNASLVGMGLNPDSFFAGSGTVTVVPVGVPGDYNGNGTVDAADYALWRNGGPLKNDFTPGAQAADYDFWRVRFGATTNPGSGSVLGQTGVPEPSSIALLGWLGAILCKKRDKC